MSDAIVSPAVPTEYVKPGEVLREYPNLDRGTLVKWCVYAAQIGRPVRTVPDPKHPGWRLICLDDVAAATARFRDDLPDCLVDKDGVGWVAEDVLRRRHGLGWKPTPAEAAATLHGGQLRRATFRQWQAGDGRAYAARADMAAFMRTWARSLPAGFVDARAADAMGFDGKFLARHSDSGSPERQVAAVAYPSLERLIRTVRLRVRCRRGRRWRVGYSLADLAAILASDPPDPAIWLQLRPACRQYRLGTVQVSRAVRAGRVAKEQFAVKRPAWPRPTLRPFFDRRDLAVESARHRVAVARFANRPTGVDAGGRRHPFVKERGHVEAGRLYWPVINAAQLAGVNAGSLRQYRSGCNKLPGGRPIRFIVRPVSWRVVDPATGKPAAVYLYDDDDLNAIWKAKGHKGRRRSKPTGRTRGRQAVGDPAADAAFATAYAAAKAGDSTVTVASFAGQQTPRITVKEAQRRLGRHRFRLSKAARG